MPDKLVVQYYDDHDDPVDRDTVVIRCSGAVSLLPNLQGKQQSKGRKEVSSTVLRVNKDGLGWKGSYRGGPHSFDVDDFLEWWLADSHANGGRFGVMTGTCIWCGREISDATSLAKGYGPDCAKELALTGFAHVSAGEGWVVDKAQEGSSLRNVNFKRARQSDICEATAVGQKRARMVTFLGKTTDQHEVRLGTELVKRSAFLNDMIDDMALEDGAHDNVWFLPVCHRTFRAVEDFLSSGTLTGAAVLDVLQGLGALGIDDTLYKRVVKAVGMRLQVIKTRKQLRDVVHFVCQDEEAA